MMHSQTLGSWQSTCLDRLFSLDVSVDLPIGVRRVAGAGMVTSSVGG